MKSCASGTITLDPYYKFKSNIMKYPKHLLNRNLLHLKYSCTSKLDCSHIIPY